MYLSITVAKCISRYIIIVFMTEITYFIVTIHIYYAYPAFLDLEHFKCFLSLDCSSYVCCSSGNSSPVCIFRIPCTCNRTWVCASTPAAIKTLQSWTKSACCISTNHIYNAYLYLLGFEHYVCFLNLQSWHILTILVNLVVF